MPADLLAVDVDADEVGRHHEIAVAIHIVVGRAEFGAGCDHQIGFGDKRPHGLQAGACRHTEWMLVEQAARISGLDHRRVE